MSYATVKKYFVRRLASFNLQEAKKKISFENAAENFDNQFIFENPKTDLDDGDTLANRFFPKRSITIRTAHKTSEGSLLFDYDSVHTRLENVLRDLHSSSNYRTDGIRRIVFNTLSVTVVNGYISGDMSFTVEDALAYV